MSPEEIIVSDGVALLERARRDRSEWERVRFSPRGHAGERRDENALARLQLAWALQHDYRAEDRALVLFALEEEIKWREEDPWQGVGEALELLAGLTAQARDPENVWLLARAKRANFDTACGFALEYAFAGGVTTTLELVRRSSRDDRQQTLETLLDENGEPLVDDDAVQRWLAGPRGSLPADEATRAMVWFDRALLLDRRRAARGFLERWLELQDRADANTLSSLAYRLEDLEAWAEASAARKDRFPSLRDPFEIAGEACRIARLERLAGRQDGALGWLQRAGELHDAHPDWRELGLGRQFVEECFRCAAALGSGRGEPAFALAERFAATTPGLPLVALEAAVLAASSVRPSELGHYAALHEAEERRIAELRSAAP